jgi:hypothetical protein
MDVKEATAGLKDIANSGKRHYLWMGILLLVVVAVVIRYRTQIGNALGGLHPSIAKFLGVAVAALVVFFGLPGLAEAATCCASPVAHAVQSGGFLDSILTALAAAAGSGAMAIVAFPAPDVVEAKLANGNKTVTYTPGAAQSYDFFVDGSVNISPENKPLCAVSQVIELATTVNTPSTGTASLKDDDLARLIGSVQMHGDPLGTILDSTVGTGPILKHLIEFVGLGFNRGPDAPVATVTVPASSSTAATYTRRLEIPHSQGWHTNPMSSALWLGIIDQLKITVTLAASTALAAVSTGATSSGAGSTLRVITPVVPNTHWHWPILAQWILETPEGGSNTVKLRRFGEANASGTEAVDYLHTVAYLSNKVGLPGNQALDNLASVNCPKLGIYNMQNLNQFSLARIEAQRWGQAPVGMSQNMNYVQDAVSDGNDMDSLKFLMLRQPGLDMRLDGTKAVVAGYDLPIELTYTGATPSTNHAVVLGSMRFLSQSIAGALSSAPNSKLTANRNQVTLATK